MKRNEWEFEYTAVRLVEAAQAKRERHQKLFEWWEGKKKDVLQRVKDGGIQVHDSVAAGIRSTKGDYGPQVEIDGGLQRDLTECQSKIREHASLVSSYDGWRQVLAANPESRLRLNHDDWLYFFGDKELAALP